MNPLRPFIAHMTLHGFLREVAYRIFLLTLRRSTRVWFGSLMPESIDSFEELAHLFLTQFMASRRSRCPVAYLLTIKHGEDEGLKTYLSRFNKECITTDNLDEKITLVALLGGVWP